MSDKKARVETYFDGFRRSDHAMILVLLSEDVRWDMPGFKHVAGKAAFDAEIENPEFSGSPILTIDRLIAEGDTVVAIGEVVANPKARPPVRLAYCDVFTFTGELISRVESYLVPLNESQNVDPAG
jgi:ketosteroid isomerase-like protein